MKLKDLFSVGDMLDYTKVYGNKKVKHRKGIITQVTDTLIAIDLGKYRDSFTIQDLACGEVIIPGLGEVDVTTSEANQSIKNPVQAEILREIEECPKEKEVNTMPAKMPVPTKTELQKIYNEGNQSIKFVQDYYGVSRSPVIKWLKKYDLYVAHPRGNKQASKQEAGLDSKQVDNAHEGTLPPSQNQSPVVMKTEHISTVPRHPNGTIDWEKTWPLVQAELNKGLSRYEVAEMFGISANAIRKHIYSSKAKPANPTKSAVKLDRFAHLKYKTREELLIIKSALAEEGEAIDIIISCIDKTLMKNEGDINAAV